MLQRVGWVLGLGVALCAMAGPAAGQERKEPKKQAQVRVPEGVKAERDLDYAGSGNRQQMLDLYLPEDATGPLPLVVWIHGGGWRSGSKANCPALPLTKRGYAVASLNYRLTDEAHFPAQIEDCRAAIRWLKANAKKYQIDPDRIGVWGASAGGHLVALLGTSADVKGWDGVGGHTDQSASVKAVCDYFGPVDFLHNYNPDRATKADSPVGRLLGGPLKDKQDAARKASPLTYIARDNPPFLIVHGDQDPLVPLKQSELLLAALNKAGVPATLVKVKNGKHGAFGPDCEPSPDVIRDTVFGFFDKYLRSPSP